MKTSIIEEDEGELAVRDGKLALPIGPASIETLRVEFGR